jgi:hypothetical protein
VRFAHREYECLRVQLQAADDASQLPELPSDETHKSLNDLLVRGRLKKLMNWEPGQLSVRVIRTK